MMIHMYVWGDIHPAELLKSCSLCDSRIVLEHIGRAGDQTLSFTGLRPKNAFCHWAISLKFQYNSRFLCVFVFWEATPDRANAKLISSSLRNHTLADMIWDAGDQILVSLMQGCAIVPLPNITLDVYSQNKKNILYFSAFVFVPSRRLDGSLSEEDY